MPNRVRVLTVSEADRVELARRVRAKGSPAREVERARIVLLAAEGVPGKQIAARVGCAEPTVVMWRSRFAERGLAGLADAPRSGKPATIPQSVRDEILSITLTEPPVELGITHWSSRLLADRLRRDGKPVSHATVARVWKHFGIQPHRFGTFKFSTDPELEAKVRDIVGLYLDPPDKAVVLCVDEKLRWIPASVATPRGVGGRDGIEIRAGREARTGAADGAAPGVHQVDHQGGQQLRGVPDGGGQSAHRDTMAVRAHGHLQVRVPNCTINP